MKMTKVVGENATAEAIDSGIRIVWRGEFAIWQLLMN